MTTHEPILARLAALKAMSVNELKAEWQALFDAPAPNNSRNFLEGRLAYRIQELTYGGPDKQTRRLLDLLADEVEGTLTRKAQIADMVAGQDAQVRARRGRSGRGARPRPASGRGFATTGTASPGGPTPRDPTLGRGGGSRPCRNPPRRVGTVRHVRRRPAGRGGGRRGRRC